VYIKVNRTSVHRKGGVIGSVVVASMVQGIFSSCGKKTKTMPVKIHPEMNNLL
jgi:hypothetical protein